MLVTKQQTKKDYLNHSDHVPITLHLNIDVAYLNTYKREFKPNVAWPKCHATIIDEYKSDLDLQLLKINPKNEALSCRNFRCKLHKKEIQEIHNNIVGCIKQASSNSLPHTSNVNGRQGRKVVPGWNEHVKEHAINAKYWNDIWIQSGKPRNDGIARMRSITKLRYHYAVRYVNRENIRLRNQRMGEDIAEKNDRIL